MRIVIDMQGAQTESRFRGIGRHTLSFVQAIAHNRGEHEILLALSGFFPETIEPIRAAFDGLLPQENIRVWYAPGPVREADPENKSRREVAELIREAFLASLQPDVVHISSLFEGWEDDGVVSIGRFDQHTPISILSYQPSLQFEAEYKYSSNSIYTAYYQRKLELQKKAVICVDVPEFTLKDGNNSLQDTTNSIWYEVAKHALTEWMKWQNLQTQQKSVNLSSESKPRLAFVSPLPPERTGIADYSAELLPALAEYYDLEMVVEQSQVDNLWPIEFSGKIHDVAWLRKHAQELDRVVYQMGNSLSHAFMLPLLKEIPGTVVLHDFYLSGLMSWLEDVAGARNAWVEALYHAHGYIAVRQRFFDVAAATAMKYPVNLYVMQQAQGLIVHSEYSKMLAQLWYGSDFLPGIEVIPLTRAPADKVDKTIARKILNIPEDVFLVCSFGVLNTTKLNHRLLNSWFQSALAADKQCQLVFVGENCTSDYGSNLLQTIKERDFQDRIHITGFVSADNFHQYLAAADVAVQLRTHSRGETSAAVLDCMNYGLPLIVNANGSMAELAADAVWMLADEFEDEALVLALETLWYEPERRNVMSTNAREIILNQHAPNQCAKLYTEAIERFHQRAENTTPNLIKAITAQENYIPNDAECQQLATVISATLPMKRPAKSLFLDVTETCNTDLKTGIQRVVRAIMLTLLETPPEGYRVEPIYLSYEGGKWHYRYARSYVLGLLGCSSDAFYDEVVEPDYGDILLGLDFCVGHTLEADAVGLFSDYKNRGVSVFQVVYDLLPVIMPEVFPPETDMYHAKWLHAISKFDGAFCISKAVADELALWQKKVGIDWKYRRPFQLCWFHLGADIANSAPSGGLPESAKETLKKIQSCPSFLMVGTLEPRKGHAQTLAAFDKLWADGINVALVIVGKHGWMVESLAERLRTHPELDKHLFWLEGISDEYLEKVYASSTCLIAASEAEGFGLPLIEAAQHKLPIIARDIPVFREVAGAHAHYFDATSAEGLAQSIKIWLALHCKGNHPKSDEMPWLTWAESADQLVDMIVANRCRIATRKQTDSQ